MPAVEVSENVDFKPLLLKTELRIFYANSSLNKTSYLKSIVTYVNCGSELLQTNKN